MGREVAIDATDMPAYANGQKYDGSGPRKKPFSDPDAAWGFRSAVSTRRGGGFYGYKLHAAACARRAFPSRGASRAATAKKSTSPFRFWTL